MGLFSGDFIFVGDIGRPDLLEKSVQMEGTTEIGAKQMYQSIEGVKIYQIIFKYGLDTVLEVLVVKH